MASMAPRRLDPRFEDVVRGQVLGASAYVTAEFADINLSDLPQTDNRTHLRAVAPFRAQAPDTTMPDAQPERPEGYELIRTIIENYILPSYRAATDANELLTFWLDKHEDFQHLVRAHKLVAAEQGGGGAASRPQETPARGVYEIAGERGESIYRGARADLAIANYLVQSFQPFSPEDQEKAIHDNELIRYHNISRRVATSVLTSVSLLGVLAPVAEVSEAQINVILDVCSSMAALVLNFAEQGANLRGVRGDFPVEVLYRAWPAPCGAMFKYLAKRSPALLFEHITRESNLGLRARAVEAVSQVSDHDVARTFLISQLSAPVAIQEAAIHALRAHPGEETLSALRKVAADPNTSEIIVDLVAEELEAN